MVQTPSSYLLFLFPKKHPLSLASKTPFSTGSHLFLGGILFSFSLLTSLYFNDWYTLECCTTWSQTSLLHVPSLTWCTHSVSWIPMHSPLYISSPGFLHKFFSHQFNCPWILSLCIVTRHINTSKSKLPSFLLPNLHLFTMSVDGNSILPVTLKTKNSTKSSLILLTPHTKSFNKFYWLYLQNTSRLLWLLITSPTATLVQTTMLSLTSRPQTRARGIQMEDHATLLLKTHFAQSKMAWKVQHWEFSHLKVTVLTISSTEISSPDNCMAQPSMPSGLHLNLALPLSFLTPGIVLLLSCFCMLLFSIKVVTTSHTIYFIYVCLITS